MITTPRLTIRPFQEDDAASLVEYLSNPAVYRFEPGAPVTLDETKDLARERAAGRTRPLRVRVIRHPPGNRLLQPGEHRLVEGDGENRPAQRGSLYLARLFPQG
ncbi:MAG: GNAT family N-acetyltransferase [Chloroflexi bacterium]|nr:GNAT family N-acetyltransferase [Chloroflexota bacterium]